MTSSSDVDLADRFDISGPTHMMVENGAVFSPMLIHWDKEEYRLCVAACLVKGVKVMIKDKRRGRTKPLAPAWWEGFGFRHLDVIKVDTDEIFGAIYEYVPPAGVPHHPSAPGYIVAFRGTIFPHLSDLIQDIKIIGNTFPNSKRCKISREEQGRS